MPEAVPTPARFPARTERLLADPASRAWALHGRALAERRAGREVLLLSVGDPDFDTPASIVAAAQRALRAGRTHYPPIAGEAELRQAIADHQAALAGVPCSAEQVQVFAGGQNALFMILHALTAEGDEVLAGDPYYATYPGVVAASGARLRCVDTAATGWRLTAEGLAAALTPSTRVVLLNTPGNPCGTAIAEAEMARIVALCRRHGLWLVADEVYADLRFEGAHVSAWSHAHEHDRIVVVGSASKRFAMTGWRLGWCVAPEDLILRLKALATAGLFGTPPFLQDALTAALREPPPEAASMRETYRRRARTVLAALAEAGLAGVPPDGGMFVAIDLRPNGLDGTALAERLLQDEGVAVMPGIAFGQSLAQGLRLSLVADEVRLASACRAIARTAERLSAESRPRG
ncbi:MAG: arginine--pyruvate transaminase AruH [Lysobacteraceae bacterium]|nr:MAG: arginine--pyruvate transaminase AruH [Xanthomonadaceae bacterium]